MTSNLRRTDRLVGIYTAVALLALCPVLASCDRKSDSAAAGNTQAAARTADGPPEIEAYLSQFKAGDPENCFNDPALVDASFTAYETASGTVPPARVIVAVDASGSMAGRVSSRPKLDLAKSAAAAFVEELPATAEAGLLVFGQAGNNRADGKALSCAAVDLPVEMTHDRAALLRSVSTIQPVGWTPLTAVLKRAEALLTANGRSGDQIIYVVSDGQETCGGDPVAVARSINQGSTKAIINIIGFAVPSGEAVSLQAVAAAGGGRFVNAGTDREVDATVARIREDGRKAKNRLAQSGAVAQNRIAASGAAAKARICAGGLAAKERIAVSADVAKKRVAGKDVAFEERAEKILAKRHAALERRAEAFVRAAEAKGDRANEAIGAKAEQAR
jgi:Ca-activated chloride channel family protein